jgi:predicted MPP superfamily phosphohydrolase
MQRVDLPPPTKLGDAPASGRDADDKTDGSLSASGSQAAVDADPVLIAPASIDHLEDPHTAVERRRPLFHPARGWFRRAERAVSHYLARAVYPSIPGLSLPYSRQLRRDLVLSEATIDLIGLPQAFDGLRVLLITDIHAGPFLKPEVLREAIGRLGTLDPDLILIGGDLVLARPIEIEHNAETFRSLTAPLGVFAVLGNHDHYTHEPERVIAQLEECGIQVLHNASTRIERDGQTLALAGVDDMLVGNPDLDRALADTEPPVILLCHHPDLLFEAARHGVALMLSGHTHAGQIRIPRLPVLVRQSRYRLDEGRFRYRETELVVSRGIGAVGVPFRLACPPEAVLLTLRRVC